MTKFVLLSYGRKSEYHRAIFTVLSFWAWYSGDPTAVETIIFTDDPTYFRPSLTGLPVSYVQLTPAQLTAMRGPDNYVHRIKIAMMDQVFQQHPGCNILYSDADAFFVLNPAPLLARIEAGETFMHKAEYSFAQGAEEYASFGKEQYPLKFIELLESRTFSVAGQERQFSREDISWNSGVLGLNREVARLMPDVYALNDAAFRYTGWFTCEQLAFSLVLQTATPLTDCEPYVLHYWGQQQKEVVDKMLSKLLNRSFLWMSLPGRLQRVQRLTSKWQRQLELVRLQEGSLYAFNNRQIGAGVKYALKALAHNPFDMQFCWELLTVGSKGAAA